MIDGIRQRLNTFPKPVQNQILLTSLLSTVAAVAGLTIPYHPIVTRLYPNNISLLACSVSFSYGMSTYCWTSYALKKFSLPNGVNQIISVLFALIIGAAVYFSLNACSTQFKFLVTSVTILTHVIFCLALKKNTP